MKKVLIFLFIAFIIFLFFYKRSTISFEGNNWNAEKLIINNKVILNNKTKPLFPTRIIVNDYIDSLTIINPKFKYRFKLIIEKNKFNKDVAILKSKNILLNDTLEIKLDTIEDNYYRTRKFVVELKSKRTLIKMYLKKSTIPTPRLPRKPIKGLP